MGCGFIYQIINVNEWDTDYSVHAGGTRAKVWKIHPETGQLVLVKWPKYDIGEIYAEKVASEIGKCIGIQTMDVDLGLFENKHVILAYNFLEPGEQLIEGGDFFEGYKRQSSKPLLAPNYTFQQIKSILNRFELLAEFIDIVVFDCLIFNSDRHQDNWGICKKGDFVRLAPAYDNSSSLAWQLKDSKVRKTQQDKRSYQAFIKNGPTLIRWEQKSCRHFDFVRNVYNDEPRLCTRSISKVEKLSYEQLSPIVNSIPDVLLSQIKKKFVIDTVLLRRDKLLNLLKEGG